MTPILYEPTETAFTSGGLGRLVDCIECIVTEELNTGVFECDFKYPVSGDMFDEIQLGRIIAVSHDDTGDIQPFDIVSYSRPIDGVVSFHAVHISYRLTRYIAVPQYPVDDVGDAWTLFDNAYPQLIAGRFHFSAPGWTPPTVHMTAPDDGIPRSVREYIGGIEGGLLDTYGGEILWDIFDVKLVAQRGQSRDWFIRYGVNMADYNETSDGQETFTRAIPYWDSNGVVVVGDEVDSGLTPYDRALCIAMDLTDKFENQPTKAELEAEALAIMTSGAPNLPKRSFEIDFVRLQDLDGYEDLTSLLQCALGDTLTVIFPAYNMQGTFRIVKVVWDALRERFETMTLGTLETTLAEALGVTGGTTTIGGSGGSVVTWTQITSTGTKIAEISINGTSQDVYAPSGGGGGVFYGTCSTAANGAAKVVSCPSFTSADLVAGAVVYVDFTNTNTVASPTLNVNSTGAKGIMRYGTTSPSGSAASSWNAGAVVCMVYDGTYWNIEGWLNTTYSAISQANIESLSGTGSGLITGQRMTDGVAKRVKFTQITSTGTKIGTIEINGTATDIYAPSGGGTQTVWSGTCSTAENTAAKVVTTTGGGFTLTAGNVVFVKFDHRLNTASTTLNVDGTGAKTIKQNGAAPNLGIWQDGETVGFVYDGTNFEIIDAGKASTTDWGVTMLSSSVSDGLANVAANGAAVKTAYDLADSKSTVAWNQVQTTGTKIAEITIDGGSPTDIYAPTGGGGGSYTATAPITISALNDISHDDGIGTTGSVGSANYSSGFGYYMPYVEYDAKGHIQDAYNLGTFIPENTSSAGNGNPVALTVNSWAHGVRTGTMNGFTLSAGSTSQSQIIQTDANSVYARRTNFRIVDVQSYDMTTFEPVIVDWSCDKVFSAGGNITITVSLAQAYTHDIRWFPLLTYATASM